MNRDVTIAYGGRTYRNTQMPALEMKLAQRHGVKTMTKIRDPRAGRRLVRLRGRGGKLMAAGEGRTFWQALADLVKNLDPREGDR